MKKCYIITAYIEGNLSKIISPQKSDFIICADGGYEIAVSFSITPDLVIGDSDSQGQWDGSSFLTTLPSHKTDEPSPYPGSCTAQSPTDFIHFPREKDVSDTFLCVKHAVSLGFGEIIIVGGIGGRLDHTISNIQTLAHFSDCVKSISMTDENNFITIACNSQVTLQKKEDFTISLFSLSDKCSGVRTTGLYYPLENAELKNTYPLGLSNEFTDNEATIEVKNGKLLIAVSRKKIEEKV